MSAGGEGVGGTSKYQIKKVRGDGWVKGCDMYMKNGVRTQIKKSAQRRYAPPVS
jgi:hypothetical protein